MSGSPDEPDAEERVFRVEVLARVEGEGRFEVRLRDGVVVHARLSIFEAPRFFEAFLRGRSPSEVLDIVPRICGICPVAYQMSATRAIERALGVEPEERIRILRRVLYCGEWIESHALHVFLLHAPDFLGCPSAVEMASGHRALIEDGLAIKKAGNAIVALLGGRAIHPVSLRLGGFSSAPAPAQLRTLLPSLHDAIERAARAVRWAASLAFPEMSVPYVFVALDSDEYPLEHGSGVLVSARSGRGVERVGFDEFERSFVETQVPHSNALQCHLADGTPYLCGPAARLHHHFEKLHPVAAELAREIGLPRTVDNAYRWIIVRALEIVHALAEAIDRIDAYVRPEPPFAEVPPLRACEGAAATEAPRGLLWHRYRIGGDGALEDVRIVPPTSQNQARIEADLVALVPELTRVDHAAGTHLCEQIIRSYDPCISCATHFLRLSIEEEREE